MMISENNGLQCLMSEREPSGILECFFFDKLLPGAFIHVV